MVSHGHMSYRTVCMYVTGVVFIQIGIVATVLNQVGHLAGSSNQVGHLASSSNQVMTLDGGGGSLFRGSLFREEGGCDTFLRLPFSFFSFCCSVS